MQSEHSHVLGSYPYPVAYTYSLIFDEQERMSLRRWAICFTQYQLLRLVCLPLVSQYLREPVEPADEQGQRRMAKLNSAVAAIRSPFFSDWITLLHSLRLHLPKLIAEPLFPALAESLATLGKAEWRSLGMRRQHHLDPLHAILALRNETAHGGIPDEVEAARHVEEYLPVLHQVLDAFGFLSDVTLKVCDGGPGAVATGQAAVRVMRGARLADPAAEELSDELLTAFEESPAVLVGPQGKVVPLYPFFNRVDEREPLYLYDGHQVRAKGGEAGPGFIYYLGTYHRVTDGPSCAHLREMLKRRQISFFPGKEESAPWTIAESAADYSRRVLEELVGTKYFPACYLPLDDLEKDFDAFLRIPGRDDWGADGSARRYVNGFLLTGAAGAGKTAFLARQVERLLRPPGEAGDDPPAFDAFDDRENPNLVMFLRGDSLGANEEGRSLFHMIAENLGLAVEAAAAGGRSRGGFSSFRELLDHLHRRWKDDRVEGRRLILVLDALNEAPNAEKVIREALAMMGVAAAYPWCKVVVSTRQEWLGIWARKMSAQEIDPVEELRSFLYVRQSDVPARRSPPVVVLEPFTEEQARRVYERYQEAARAAGSGRKGPAVPACLTLWDELPAATQSLMVNPLYLHLFMEAFSGRVAAAVETVPTLFRHYIEEVLRRKRGLKAGVHAVMDHLLNDIHRPSANLNDDDCNALRRSWVEGRSAEETRRYLSPLEGLFHEGLISERAGEDGGGYRFVFQMVAEYLMYWHLSERRPAREPEEAYWARRASAAEVFPEYAGAFLFLLRDFALGGQLLRVGQFVETAAPWFGDKVLEFLIEQARVGHAVGEESEAAREAAAAMARTGGAKAAETLRVSAYFLSPTRFAPAAAAYFQASVDIGERLRAPNSDAPEQARAFAHSLNGLASSLIAAGAAHEAKAAYLRAAEVHEKLLAADPGRKETAVELSVVLANLCNLLTGQGLFAETERYARRCFDLLQLLMSGAEETLEPLVADEVGAVLINLGGLFVALGKTEEAGSAYGLANLIYADLREKRGANLDVDSGLALSLSNLANLLLLRGDTARAEEIYHKSGYLYEQLFKSHPGHVAVGEKLCMVMSNNAVLLGSVGRVEEAEKLAERVVRLSNQLWMNSPGNRDVAVGHASNMITLGNIREMAGRLAEAGEVYRQTIRVCEAMVARDPEAADGRAALAASWGGLAGVLRREPRRAAEARGAFKTSLRIYRELAKRGRLSIYSCPTHASVLGTYGMLLERLGDLVNADRRYQGAIKLLEVVREQMPHFVNISLSLATLLNRRARLKRGAGDAALSEKLLEQSARILEELYANRPQFIDVKLGYADYLQAVNRGPEAEKVIDEVLALVPAHPEAKELRAKIAGDPAHE